MTAQIVYYSEVLGNGGYSLSLAVLVLSQITPTYFFSKQVYDSNTETRVIELICLHLITILYVHFLIMDTKGF